MSGPVHPVARCPCCACWVPVLMTWTSKPFLKEHLIGEHTCDGSLKDVKREAIVDETDLPDGPNLSDWEDAVAHPRRER